ncbi:g5815 [Coccomyxa elongata]
MQGRLLDLVERALEAHVSGHAIAVKALRKYSQALLPTLALILQMDCQLRIASLPKAPLGRSALPRSNALEKEQDAADGDDSNADSIGSWIINADEEADTRMTGSGDDMEEDGRGLGMECCRTGSLHHPGPIEAAAEAHVSEVHETAAEGEESEQSRLQLSLLEQRSEQGQLLGVMQTWGQGSQSKQMQQPSVFLMGTIPALINRYQRSSLLAAEAQGIVGGTYDRYLEGESAVSPREENEMKDYLDTNFPANLFGVNSPEIKERSSLEDDTTRVSSSRCISEGMD